MGNLPTGQAGKTVKYLLYAFGEIVLVVIGILIALQINNWNENTKKTKLKYTYIDALIKDLKQDTLELKVAINFMQTDLEILKNIDERITSKHATLDTLVKIARHEFYPYFNPYNSINNNTFKTLTATGNIDLLDSWLSEALMELNSSQLQCLKIIDANISLHLALYADYNQKYNPFKSKLDAFGSQLFVKEGPLDDYLWENTDKKDLIGAFNGVYTSKGTMEQIIIYQRQEILNESLTLLDTIIKVYKKQ